MVAAPSPLLFTLPPLQRRRSTLLDRWKSQVKFWEGGDPPPCFTIDGTNYIYVRKNGLLFAVTTQWNVSPSMLLELLNRLAKVFKDYCGVLSEVGCRDG